MKIFHTETQADFDALMNWLETKGIETIEKEYWENNRGETVVFVHAIGPYGDNSRTDTTYGSLRWAIEKYPRIPITKYIVMEDDKMKFTKENVEKVVISWFWKDGNSTLDELVGELRKLDDTLERVVVPKFVAEFYEECENAALDFLITQLEASNSRSELGKWYRSCSGRHRNGRANAQEVIAKMKLYGYEVEEEPLYYIPLPHLKTTDGIQQVLSQRKGDKNYFANRPSEILKQRFTKDELEHVPEIYKPYAKPIEEENE